MFQCGLELKLTYFDARGRAELIRLTLAAAGYKYEDERLSFQEFQQLKSTGALKFGQLPVCPCGLDETCLCCELSIRWQVLTVNGKEYGQSYSIAKFIGRLSGLLPCDLERALEAEQYVDATDDIRSKIVPIRWSEPHV